MRAKVVALAVFAAPDLVLAVVLLVRAEEGCKVPLTLAAEGNFAVLAFSFDHRT